MRLIGLDHTQRELRVQLRQARDQRRDDVGRKGLKAAERQRFRGARHARFGSRPRVESLRHAVRPVRVDQRRAPAGHEDILHRPQDDEVRADSIAARDPAIEGDQRVHHARRSGELRGPLGAIEFLEAVRTAAPGEGVGDVRLILAQHVDAEHAVLQQRIRHRTQMMNAHQQRRARRIRGHRDHRGHGDPMPARDAIRRDHIDGARRVAHAEQKLLPERTHIGRGLRRRYRSRHGRPTLPLRRRRQPVSV